MEPKRCFGGWVSLHCDILNSLLSSTKQHHGIMDIPYKSGPCRYPRWVSATVSPSKVSKKEFRLSRCSLEQKRVPLVDSCHQAPSWSVRLQRRKSSDNGTMVESSPVCVAGRIRRPKHGCTMGSQGRIPVLEYLVLPTSRETRSSSSSMRGS